MIEHSALWNWTSPVWVTAFAIAMFYAIAFRTLAWRRLGALMFGLMLLVLGIFPYAAVGSVYRDGKCLDTHLQELR